MLKTEPLKGARWMCSREEAPAVVVIWTDWYASHLARFTALLTNPELAGRVAGIEMVGGQGVHANVSWRDDLPEELPVETLFTQSGWQQPKGWKIAQALWKRLNLLNPAVVLVPGDHPVAGLAAALWGKWKRRRTVLMTESTEADHAFFPIKEACKALLIRFLFDWAVGGGSSHLRYLERARFAAERVARFYDVVDNEFFNERSQAIRRHSTAGNFDLPERYFLYVGRLAEEKNVRGLIDAYLEYRLAGGRWSLVLVGDGPDRRVLERMAGACGYGLDIRFEGLRSTAELPQYYAFASCFVLPSTRDPWGLVANEAMAAGLPIIVSRACGCAEDLLMEGENGCGFDPDIPGDLAGCLSAVSALDADSLLDMGCRSEQIISQFSPAAWAAEVARIARA